MFNTQWNSQRLWQTRKKQCLLYFVNFTKKIYNWQKRGKACQNYGSLNLSFFGKKYNYVKQRKAWQNHASLTFSFLTKIQLVKFKKSMSETRFSLSFFWKKQNCQKLRKAWQNDGSLTLSFFEKNTIGNVMLLWTLTQTSYTTFLVRILSQKPRERNFVVFNMFG